MMVDMMRGSGLRQGVRDAAGAAHASEAGSPRRATLMLRGRRSGLVAAAIVVLLLGQVLACGADRRRQPSADAGAIRSVPAGRVANPADPTAVAFCGGQPACAGRNPRVANVRILQQQGARPRWSPQGDTIVFDRKNADGYYDVYLSDLQSNVVDSLTEGKGGVGQRNNGNAVFHPSGAYIVFISEEDKHFGERMTSLGDPGLGLFSNLWAADPSGSRFWKLTNMPIKQTLADRIPAMATVNPHFSPDGSVLVWTERYADGGNHRWGRWRIKAADFLVTDGTPGLANERIVFTPTTGNYVTAMGFIGPGSLLLAGNLDGQHEYGMDQYLLNIDSGALTNLQNSPQAWEEGATVSPGHRIVHMSNITSSFKLDFDNPNWPRQLREGEYWLMDADGNNKERLTYFNDSSAPEYLGKRVIAAAMDISPDGKSLVGSLGVDFGNGKTADFDVKIVLLEFNAPL